MLALSSINPFDSREAKVRILRDLDETKPQSSWIAQRFNWWFSESFRFIRMTQKSVQWHPCGQLMSRVPQTRSGKHKLKTLHLRLHSSRAHCSVKAKWHWHHWPALDQPFLSNFVGCIHSYVPTGRLHRLDISCEVLVFFASVYDDSIQAEVLRSCTFEICLPSNVHNSGRSGSAAKYTIAGWRQLTWCGMTWF